MATTFTNPVLGGDWPDPAILRDGDEYWLTLSSFDSAPGVRLYRSTDLLEWSYEGAALPDPPGIVFAMDMAKVGDRYFIYIPVIPAPWSTQVTEPSIFVIHAPTMRGPWSDPIDLGLRGVIDPGHLVDGEGNRHLFTSGINHVPLSEDGLSVQGELTGVYAGWRYPDEWITEAYALEGPKLFRRGNWYYLVSAVGGTAGPATGHMVIVARSRTPEGPWNDSPYNPVARTTNQAERWWSRGHATIFPGPGDAWWMVSHGYENGYRSLGRQLLLEPITWTDDDWPAAGLSDISVDIPAPVPTPDLAGQPSFRDALSPLTLGERWTFHAPSPGEARRAIVRDDGLELVAKGTSPADTSPLTTVIGGHHYDVEVTVELQGDDVEAGLLLFFNDRMFCGFGIGIEGMVSYAGGMRTYWREPMPPARKVILRLENRHHIVTGWYRVEGGEWTRHAVRYETSGYNANTMGDLQGLRPALYAAGEGSALFRDFRYDRHA